MSASQLKYEEPVKNKKVIVIVKPVTFFNLKILIT